MATESRKKQKSQSADKPYVANYPPLHEWLQKIDARCDNQIAVGPDYIEQWRAPGWKPFLIWVRAYGLGWDIFTSCGLNDVAATLRDAEERFRLPATK